MDERGATEGGMTVGRVAAEIGVSVRTLHHWDELGVARPSGRTSSGYRSYLPVDVARLRRVLLLRDLGVPLARIPTLLTAPAAERRAELTQRRRELADTIARLEDVARSVDRLLEADEVGVLVPEDQHRDVFGDDWNPTMAESARARWGDSAQWAEYAERSAERTPEDWSAVVGPLRDLVDELAEAKRAGIVVGSEGANALAERHRAALSEYFHCTPAMHVITGRLALTEPGMADTYDRVEPGLAAWLSTLIDANARTHGVDPETAVWE
ncbi:TipAS antibiotic-recognition domain-containing protein [Plantibacter sp. VKM Ac-2880]|uniref:MerR family transcriptional regulator n=1 Tax=Plantibacter sp. VKM Ac-2880 TaxID=2783827 RepID=UPI00188FDE4D|nr:TipAS antibiotic-recognition domain-containing protein [Plantibacter sp. VKM Ac-2880]MBF4570472.1 TipAS antibiotic-recognition domain-containing protein [Plantibacter sp. VKM Ac-2880]